MSKGVPVTRIIRTTNNKYSGNGKPLENEVCKQCNSFLGSNTTFCKRGFFWRRVATTPCFRPMKFVGTVVDEAVKEVVA